MDLEAELLKIIDSDDLEVEIKQKINSFHGFLTREAAIRLIAKEHGLLKEKVYRLAEIPKESKKVSFSATVKKIWPAAAYSSGKQSRVVEVHDDISMPLILWNDDVRLAEGLRSGDRIMVKGAYEKNGELHLGYSGKLKIDERAAFVPLDELIDGENVHVRGKINRVEGYDAFVHGINTSKAFSFIITDGTNERRVVIWENTERGERLKDGDEVIIEDGLVNNGNIDLSSDARILARRNTVIGEVTRFDYEGDRLFVTIGGKEMELDRRNALRLMKVDVADDIDLSTVATLKKDSILNSKIAVKIENGQVRG